MLRRTVIALSLVALLGGVGAAYAQGMQPGHRAHGMARMQQRLGLTDDQMTAIRAAYQKHRDEQKQTWQELRTKRAELRKLALDGADASAIEAKTAEVQQLLGQGLAARVKVLQEIGPILTPEQREKLAQASPHRGMHRHHRKPPTQS
jgi:Spy/CpxP family protein refolding chaperone